MRGFLFNGGLAGYEFFEKFHFADYQAEKIAWKSIPLTMFVTQRGLLYAIPAGLLLLLHWRRKYYSGEGSAAAGARRGLVPWWVEWSLYATMPLFHVHTFLALSIVLGFWLLIGTWETRKQIALLLGRRLRAGDLDRLDDYRSFPGEVDPRLGARLVAKRSGVSPIGRQLLGR